jgi:sulfoacetaldehyde acetyltransferase
VTNWPTVCIAQNGPGITNFVTAVAAAYWAHSPMVVVTPESGSLTAGHGGFQETEQMPIFSKITKWQVHVNSPLRMAELMHRAFAIALHERGPVQVNIPRDYFYGEGDYEIVPPLIIERAAGGTNSLDRAAKMLSDARFPVIMSGGGIVMSGGADEVKALAEHLTAPVVNTYLHNDSFPANHPLACGPLGHNGSKAAMKILARADVVLALGTAPRAIRDAPSARHRLLAPERENHPDRRRQPGAGAGEEGVALPYRAMRSSRRRNS